MAGSNTAAKVCLVVIDGWGISEETKGECDHDSLNTTQQIV